MQNWASNQDIKTETVDSETGAHFLLSKQEQLLMERLWECSPVTKPILSFNWLCLLQVSRTVSLLWGCLLSGFFLLYFSQETDWKNPSVSSFLLELIPPIESGHAFRDVLRINQDSDLKPRHGKNWLQFLEISNRSGDSAISPSSLQVWIKQGKRIGKTGWNIHDPWLWCYLAVDSIP